MRILSKAEVFTAIQQIKLIDETEGRQILEQFTKQHTNLQQVLFTSFPQAITIIDQHLSYLFMDLCFDIICVYQRLVGDMPIHIANPKWIEQTLKQIELDVSQNPQIDSDSYEGTQIELLEYLTLNVDEFIKENNSKPEAAMAIYNLLFLVTRLFDAIYDEKSPTLH